MTISNQLKKLGILLGILITAVVILLIIVYFFPEEEEVKKSPTPPRSPSPSPRVFPPRQPIGTRMTFTSKQLIVSPSQESTFNYIKVTGNQGYITYNNQPNMLMWPVKLPLSFTHAKMDGKIFEFTHPNSSDTYGQFVDGSAPESFFTDSIDLGEIFFV